MGTLRALLCDDSFSLFTIYKLSIGACGACSSLFQTQPLILGAGKSCVEVKGCGSFYCLFWIYITTKDGVSATPEIQKDVKSTKK